MDREKTNNLKKNHAFFINDQVRFFPSRRVIENVKTGTKVKLHVPASHCLDKLLQNQGSVVSQYDLIQCGWGTKRETAVSSNTFYQCILHLRKNLAQMELLDVIETIPRHGIMFNDSVSVVVTPEESQAIKRNEISKKSEILAEKSMAVSSLSDTAESLPANKDYSLHSTVTISNTSSDLLMPDANKERKTAIPYFPVTILLLLTLLVYLNFAYLNFSKENLFESYIKLPSRDCSIYAVDKRYSADEIKNIMNSVGLSCSNKGTDFFTASPMRSRLNIIHCATYEKKKQDCRSVTIVDESKEDHEI